MSNWSILKRINFIAIVLIAALVVTGAMGVFATMRLSSLLQQYSDAGGKVLLANEVAEDLFEANVAQLAYRRNPTAENADEVRQNLGEVIESRGRFETLFADDVRTIAIADKVLEDVDLFLERFGEAEAMQAVREREVRTLRASAEDVLAKAGELESLLVFDSNERARIGIADMTRAFLNSKIALERFLLTNTEADFNTSSLELDRTTAWAKDVAAVVNNGQRKVIADDIVTSLQEYEGQVRAARDAILVRNAARRDL
ncbi:MAG: hypothetical protein AAGJ74_07200, partial [Pseudomonadota bacterium]